MSDGASDAEAGLVGVRLWMLPGDGESRRRLCRENARVLSDDENAAVAAAQRPAVAERLLSSRILLRLALARHLGSSPEALRFERLSSGRLVLIEPATERVFFSLSHAGAASVVAVSPDGAVGVDLEAIDRAGVALKIAKAFFPAAEWRQIEGSREPALRALQHWSLKESVVKALGQTVWDGLGSFRFTVTDDAVRMADGSSEDLQGWGLALGIYPPGYVLAAALRKPAEDRRPAIFSLCVLGGGTADDAQPFPAQTSN